MNLIIMQLFIVFVVDSQGVSGCVEKLKKDTNWNLLVFDTVQ